MKKWYESKTMWVGIATAIIGLVSTHQDIIPEPYKSYALALSGVLTILMRLMTGKPIGGQ